MASIVKDLFIKKLLNRWIVHVTYQNGTKSQVLFDTYDKAKQFYIFYQTLLKY